MMKAEYTKQEMIRLCHSGLDSRSLRVELLKRLRMVIPFDYVYFSTTDPATQLSTSSVLLEEPPSWCMSVFLENEFLQADFNKFSEMLRNQESAAVLSQSTRHEMHRSQRYRDMLTPLGMGDELRAIFVTDAACWGTLCLHREQAESGYTAAEAAYLAQLTPHIAEGLRKALLPGDSAMKKVPNEPGVLILTDDLSIVAATPAAEHWLTELREAERADRHALPLPVRSVVAKLKAIESGMASGSTPKVRLHTRSGHWLVLYVSRLSNSAQITVIFEIAQPADIAPLMMQAYQLTKREGEITQCVLLGWSTTEIGARLHISSNTVQDHLKAIFDKVDVSSRGELAARIFTQQYQPHFQAIHPGRS
ncbi:MAG: helix-turn-helix transcriptional regulator [Anaerolineae bacterium]|nr:helix-turn-helix transcriptional regulator [Anaerolineae bacterium]